MVKPLVMVVNDDPAQSQLLTRCVAAANATSVVFSATEDALNYILNQTTPSIIITDLHLPVIDGWRLCRLLRSPEFKSTNQIPILVTSSLYIGRDVNEITREIGATGFLSFPCPDAQIEQVIRDMLAGRTPWSQPTILVVEDDSLIIQLLTRSLSANGFDVIAAGSADTARQAFRDHAPCAVFMDHHLADTTALTLLPEFKTPGSNVVVIIITGDLSADLAVAYTMKGADAFVHKPFNVKYLISLLTKAQRERAHLRIQELMLERLKQFRDQDLQLMQSAKLATIGELAAGLAHEINNPITGLMNCAEILMEELPADSKNHGLANMILSEGKRVAHMVRRLSSFAKPEDEQQSADLREITDHAITLLGARLRRSGARITTEFGESIPLLVCKPIQMLQVVLNILMNALDSLETRFPNSTPDKQVRISLHHAADTHQLALTIEDKGVGISPEALPQLFSPFFTTKPGGTGLALSLCQNIIRQHGGSIFAESELGQFTRIHILLPLPPISDTGE